MAVMIPYLFLAVTLFSFGLSLVNAAYWKITNAENTARLGWEAFSVLVAAGLLSWSVSMIQATP